MLNAMTLTMKRIAAERQGNVRIFVCLFVLLKALSFGPIRSSLQMVSGVIYFLFNFMG